MAKKEKANPGKILFYSFLALFAVSAAVVWAASALFPYHIVLGTATIPPVWAIIHTVGTLALIDTFALPYVRDLETSIGRMLAPKEWLTLYFGINVAALWLLTRFSQYLGLGISSWFVVLLLAAVVNIAQGVAMMAIEKQRK